MTLEPPPEPETTPAERPIGQVRGTRDWLPQEYARLAGLETLLLERFARAGYEPMRTPVLEFTELHERKSGAGIVSKLYGVAGGDGESRRTCLRPELTASVVRAYTAAAEPPPLPWRVGLAGPVFRRERAPQPGHYREFQQVGVELLGAGGPAADGEVIWLADWALAEAGVAGATVRIGHVGLILEMLRRSGLPTPAQAALVEMLSDAAAEGRNVRALEQRLDALAGWLGGDDAPPPVEPGDGGGIDRLFRTLVPDVTGRRSGHEILGRLRRKWDLGHTWWDVLARVRAQVHELADLRGPAAAVLDRLGRDFADLAPDSIAALRGLLDSLDAYGVRRDRVELDLGFGRGIGFYTQMIFELVAPTPAGPVEVCGGGRYDGLARVLGSDRDDRGVGMVFGLERLWHVLEARGAGSAPRPMAGFLVVATAPAAVPSAIRLASYLRAKGANAVLEVERPLEAALAAARARGLARVVAVGESADDEMGTLVLHDPGTGARSETVAYALRQLARDDAGACRR